MTRFWIGTSGWHYQHWRGNFYPRELPTREWLAYYSQEFPTVEINASFYRQPKDSTWDSWYKTAPPGFRFAVKASRFLTHIRQLREPRDSLERVLKGAHRLGDKLGPILYQLPPSFHYSEESVERLRALFALLPRQQQHVLEFRDSSWFGEETLTLLRKHRVAFCAFDMPGLECPLETTADFGYMRFHGSGERYGSNYTDDLLEEWSDRLRKAARDTDEFYVYFNNDAYGYAVANARKLREMLP
ncbi:MAG TPA: DUF72 domain-containing protein [Dehalococcoidia bacterium]|nr:DUF72 domain-containing protein [Dehalococcoidia bacterium]